MIFSVTILGSPYSSQSVHTALHFTTAALSAGHTIYRIFFYHDGVYAGTSLSTPPQEEPNLPDQWSKLAVDYDLDIVVCIASALKRGILDEREAKRHDKSAFNLAESMELSGLGQLVDAGIQSDRLVTFGP